MAEEIAAHPEAELLYSDEDKIDSRGRRFDPNFKPDWNQDLILGQNCICHFGVYSRRRVLAVGGFREGFEGAQDWDLALRFTQGLAPHSIRHIPAVLYHWRMHPDSTAMSLDTKSYASQAQYRSVSESLSRQGERARLERVCDGAYFLPHFAVQGRPLVSIVIPTRNDATLLRRCLDSLRKTDYPRTEILVIDNQSDDPETLAYLARIEKLPGCRVVGDPHPFNYAAMHNRVVPQARGEYVCLLNNDIEVIAPGWLGDMLGAAQRAEVGAVGAKLLYPDGCVQHGGVLLGIGGIAGHAHKYMSGHLPGTCGRGVLLQSFSSVTGACMLLRKEHWLAVGGMREELPIAFNDVDLCLRLREKGLRNLWIPSALLLHHESKSRGADTAGAALRRFGLEHAYMQWRWGPLLAQDPAYNPNLTRVAEDFSLAFPPRVRRPWRREPVSVDVPYGLPGLPMKGRMLEMGGELAGAFRIPCGLRGRLTGVSVMIGNHAGRSDGNLILDLRDDAGAAAQGHAPLAGSADNALLAIPLSGDILLRGQERLNFSFRLEKASWPVAFWMFPLDEKWGHAIAGDEDKALRMVLQVEAEAEA
jgi:GT2 family glycosyltransferase